MGLKIFKSGQRNQIHTKVFNKLVGLTIGMKVVEGEIALALLSMVKRKKKRTNPLILIIKTTTTTKSLTSAYFQFQFWNGEIRNVKVFEKEKRRTH